MMAAVGHLGFSECRIHYRPVWRRGQFCVVMPNRVEVGQTVAEIEQLRIF